MPQITLPIELPAIDLGTIVPIIALVVLAALILVTLTARSIIKSRAFGLGIFALIIIAGSATIVGSLQAIALLIGVAALGIVAVVIALGRNAEVLDVVRTAVEHQAPRLSSSGQTDLPPLLLDHRGQVNQLPAAGQPAPRRASNRSTRPPEGWGF